MCLVSSVFISLFQSFVCFVISFIRSTFMCVVFIYFSRSSSMYFLLSFFRYVTDFFPYLSPPSCLYVLCSVFMFLSLSLYISLCFSLSLSLSLSLSILRPLVYLFISLRCSSLFMYFVRYVLLHFAIYVFRCFLRYLCFSFFSYVFSVIFHSFGISFVRSSVVVISLCI